MPVDYYSEQRNGVVRYTGTPEQLEDAIAPARYRVALMLQTAKLKHERLRHVRGISNAALEAKIEAETIESVLHEIDGLPNLI